MFGFFNNFFQNFVEIQVQEGMNGWRTIEQVDNDPNVIYLTMEDVASSYPNYRVRAVDVSGNIVDML
jgi:hypothetical protein